MFTDLLSSYLIRNMYESILDYDSRVLQKKISENRNIIKYKKINKVNKKDRKYLFLS